MRWLLTILLLLGSLAAVDATDAMTGHIVKVLPLFLDLNGQDALSPSLYDRDAYQVYLRAHTNEIPPSASMCCGARRTRTTRS